MPQAELADAPGLLKDVYEVSRLMPFHIDGSSPAGHSPLDRRTAPALEAEMGHRRRRHLMVAAFSLSLTLTFSTAAAAAPPLPNSMASTGDSITRAFNTGFLPLLDNPAASWSTGTSTTVNSHYRRILLPNPAISGKNFNHAKSGARMADLNAQVAAVNTRKVQYVTILMGGNDVCTSTEAAMTPVLTFRAQFQTAMTTLTAGSPNANVYVVSIPNAYQLWAILKDNASARKAWSSFGICQSLLANPLSTDPVDENRRLAVKQRNVEFNTQLAEVCAPYPRCRFDSNRVFDTAFTQSDISTRDYFHPSLAGQKKLAEVSWAAGFWP